MNNEKKTYPAKLILVLRALGGGYLAYLAWDLRDSVFTHTGWQQIGFGAAIVIFAVVGLLFGGFAVKALIRGEYAENMNDDEE